MRFKVDENLPVEIVDLLERAGHEALSVVDQDLKGAADRDVARISTSEGRVLVSLDLDFSDIRAYPPSDHAGLIVLRLRSSNKLHLLKAFRRTLPLLEREPLKGALWIIEEDRVRIRE